MKSYRSLQRRCAYLLPTGFVLICATALPSAVWGQWTGGPTGPIFYNGGNVGIGTSSPQTTLHVAGYGLFTGGFSVHWTPAMGGTNGITIGAGSKALPPGSGNTGGLMWTSDDATNPLQAYAALVTDSTAGNRRLSLQVIEQGVAYRNLTLNEVAGNVGIGTTDPQYRLAVNGNIGAQDIIVTNTGWSDYVFRHGYRLRPLSEVSAFIQKHHHLPDIPTKAEVKENGVSVGEMQAKLLAKIEELTLHMIEAEKTNEKSRQRNQELEKRVSRLEAR